MSLFEVKPYDREVYEKELKDFLPQKILDVHTHVYLKAVSYTHLRAHETL